MSLIARLRALEAARLIAASQPDAPAAVVEGDALEVAPVQTAEPVQEAEPLDARLSPARRHRQLVMASMGRRVLGEASIGGAAHLSPHAANDGPFSPEEAQIRLMLIDHQRSLKATMSTKSKEAMKRDFLPLYDAWIAGVLAANTGYPNDVLTTIMVWRMDVGDFVGAMPIIEYVLKYDLKLPERFKSTSAVFITDTIADTALKAFALGGDAAADFPNGVLGHLEDLIEDIDIHDEVRAKLQAAIAKAILAGGDESDRRARAGEALKRYMRALDLDERVGVKKDVAALQREINKGEATAPATAAPAAAIEPAVDTPAVDQDANTNDTAASPAEADAATQEGG